MSIIWTTKLRGFSGGYGGCRDARGRRIPARLRGRGWDMPYHDSLVELYLREVRRLLGKASKPEPRIRRGESRNGRHIRHRGV